jgi:hypothetical protein
MVDFRRRVFLEKLLVTYSLKKFSDLWNPKARSLVYKIPAVEPIGRYYNPGPIL